jgi:GH18 family chitinase
MITMAIPVSNWFGQWHDFEFLVNHIDFFNAMTYGTHGNWSSHSGHLAPLYSSPPNDPDGSCHANMNYLSNTRGIPKNKLNMGMPFWGVEWESSNINESFTGNTVDIMYYDIPDLIGNGWTYHWDNDALCPYLIKDDNTRVITYENQQSIGLKCQYASEQELGGVMIWALSYDKTNNGQELIQSIQENYLSNYSEEPSLMPTNISLNTYPNPFNPSCKIDIKLGQGQFVKVMVNDLQGHEIKLLNNKVLQKGSHQFLWDAKNYPNGTYFITIKNDQSIETKKVTLLK